MLEKAGYQVEDHILRSRNEVETFKAEHGVTTKPFVFISRKRVCGSDVLERSLRAA